MDDKEQERQAQELTDKNVAFYETFLSAWVDNRMETDKQLLTLSSLAIGLLMIFYDKLDTGLQFSLWLASGVLFIATIIVVLCVFRNNTKYIECLISESNEQIKNVVEKSLQRLTACAFAMFILAIVVTFALAIVKSGFIITKAGAS